MDLIDIEVIVDILKDKEITCQPTILDGQPVDQLGIKSMDSDSYERLMAIKDKYGEEQTTSAIQHVCRVIQIVRG